MKRMIAAAALLSSSLLPAPASAGPTCPDLVGTWAVAMSCVAVPRDPAFETLPAFNAVVEEQQGCLFRGTFGVFAWVGVIAADGTVYTDHAGAKGVGELTARRGGIYTGMNFTYTFGPGPSTACMATATRG